MSKRLSQEELEHDPLIENYNKAVTYVNANRTPILSIVIGAVVIIGALIGYNLYSETQEVQAQNLLAIASQYYRDGDFDKALNGDSFELNYGFNAIAKEFSGTDAGNLAMYYASVCNFKLGNTESALEQIQMYAIPKGILGVGAHSFHANLLASNGSTEAAAELYEKAASWDENNSTTPFNLLKAAELHFKSGNVEKAEELAQSIIDDYPDSIEFAEAQKMQGMIAANA
ncbi:MAG: tetratricopeptide repeat protein [Bacteroidota bacterium]